MHSHSFEFLRTSHLSHFSAIHVREFRSLCFVASMAPILHVGHLSLLLSPCVGTYTFISSGSAFWKLMYLVSSMLGLQGGVPLMVGRPISISKAFLPHFSSFASLILVLRPIMALVVQAASSSFMTGLLLMLFFIAQDTTIAQHCSRMRATL